MLSSIEQLITSGRIIDVMLLLILIEIILIWQFKKALPMQLKSYLVHLVSGVFLMLALRAVMTDMDWRVVALLLLFSGLAHLIEVRQYLKTY